MVHFPFVTLVSICLQTPVENNENSWDLYTTKIPLRFKDQIFHEEKSRETFVAVRIWPQATVIFNR